MKQKRKNRKYSSLFSSNNVEMITYVNAVWFVHWFQNINVSMLFI